MQEKFDRLFLKALPELRRYGYTLLMSRHINSGQMNIDDMINNVYLNLRKSTDKDSSRLERSTDKEFKGACMKYMKFEIGNYFSPDNRANKTVAFTNLAVSSNVQDPMTFEEFASIKNNTIMHCSVDSKRLELLINSYSDSRAIKAFKLRGQGYTDVEITSILKIDVEELTKILRNIRLYLKSKLLPKSKVVIKSPRIAIVLKTKQQNLKRELVVSKIKSLLSKGVPVGEIAKRLNINRGMVYHYFKPEERGKSKRPSVAIKFFNRHIVAAKKRDAVREALRTTSSPTEISRLTGVERTMVIYHIKKIKEEDDKKTRRLDCRKSTRKNNR